MISESGSEPKLHAETQRAHYLMADIRRAEKPARPLYHL